MKGAMNSSPVQRTGAAPVYQAAVDYQFAELMPTDGGNPRAAILTLKVPATMTKRRLYCYTVIDFRGGADAASYFSVEFFLNSTSVGKVPIQNGIVTGNNVVSTSLVSVCSGLINPSCLPPNALRVVLCKPQVSTQESSVLFMVPFEFTAEIDEVRLNFDRVINGIFFYRVILAMVSSI